MYTIGELSKITGLTVKSIRFYHEQGLLAPSFVHSRTGYRYYTERDAEKARVIAALRALEFGLKDIAAMLARYQDEQDILAYLETQKQAVEAALEKNRGIAQALEKIIRKEREALKMVELNGFAVTEKDLPPLLIGGVRMKGKYSDCGKGFALLGKKLGRYLAGPPLCLYYDGEYKEDDADFEACFPLKQHQEVAGISIRELPGGRCISLMHQGPYEELRRSYQKILGYINQHELKAQLPSREVYHKGPGMIFKGNPKNYLTEIQIPLDGSDAA